MARLGGLSPAAVSRQTAELIALGLLREVPMARTTRQAAGRPHVPVDLAVKRYLTRGVHIALGHSTVALMDMRGRVWVDPASGVIIRHGPLGWLCGGGSVPAALAFAFGLGAFASLRGEHVGVAGVSVAPAQVSVRRVIGR